MKPSASVPIPRIALLLAVINTSIRPSNAFTHQIDYNDERGEYCYNESFNLGTCLGKQQRDQDDVTNTQIIQCMECSGKFQGDETCAELKALNDVEIPRNESNRFSTDSPVSFCKTYDICVEENCPKQCFHEQVAWLECLVIELDCDWRCPGSTWSGNRLTGLNKNGATFELRSRDAPYFLVWGLVLIGGALVGWTP